MNSGFVGSFNSMSLSSTMEPVNSSLPLNPEVVNQGHITGIQLVCSSEGMTIEQKIEILVGGFQVSREAASLIILLLSGASFLLHPSIHTCHLLAHVIPLSIVIPLHILSIPPPTRNT